MSDLHPPGRAARVVAAIGRIPARLRGRDDREHEMSFNRLAFAVLITGVLLANGVSATHSAVLLMAAFIALAMTILLHIVVYPAISNTRRFCALLLDSVFLSWQLHLGGELSAAFFPIYLWVAFGNGFRFGLNWLRIAMLVTFVGFAVVVLNTPFWTSQWHLSAGLLASLIVLPTYAGTLISRLSKARKQAEQASEAKTLFLASVSHELRTPLTAIIGMSGMLRETRLDTSQREMSETIQDAAASLLSLITSILDYAQIEAGRMPVLSEAFDLSDLLRETRSLVAAQARLKGLAIAVHVDARTPGRISSSRRDLSDILVNLAANAVKFTAHGTVVIAVGVEAASDTTTRLVIRVIDSGIGIPAESQKRIFESFTQADTSIRNRFGGTGLGLSIARRRAELLGGSLDVRSVEGHGAEFILNVVAGAVVEPVEHAEEPIAPSVCTLVIPGPRGLRRDAIARDLLAAGYPVIGVEEASSRLGRTAPDRPDCSLVMVAVADSGSQDFASSAEAMSLNAMKAGLPSVIVQAEAPAEFDHLAWPFSAVLSTSGAVRDVSAAIAVARARARAHGSASPPAADAAALPARSRHVLIADDNQVNRRVLSKILESAGHTMTVVENGDQALDALETRMDQFDIVLMDMNMPVMDGVEATKLFRFMETGPRHLPIVGLTADATPEAAQRCLDAGMDLCVTKPVRPDALLKLVSELAAGHRGQTTEPPARQPAVSRQQPNGETWLDHELLKTLEQLGGRDFLSRLVDDFLVEAQETVAEIVEAASQVDHLRFRSAVHALQSSAANIGAKRLAERCNGWQRCRSAEFPGTASEVPGILHAEMSHTRDCLLEANASLVD